MSTIKNRYEFLMYIACKNANPNGDPDMANAPRTDPDTLLGYMTDVCIKRRVRDYIQIAYPGLAGMDIFVEAGTDLNVAIAQTKQAAGIPVNGNQTIHIDPARKAMCRQFYDVRTFGAVMSTGPNAGQVCGPVQLAFAQSMDPVQEQDIAVTRVASSNASGKTVAEYEASAAAEPADKLRTIGRKQFIPFGLYRVHGFISANMAAQTGFTDEDLNVLFEALANMYDTLHTSSKGDIHLAGPIVIFKHEGDPSIPAAAQANQARLGRAPAHKLFELVRCAKKPNVTVPRDYRDYLCQINLSALPAGVRAGFRLPFDTGIIWDKLPQNEDWMTSI